jgi:tripartite-type tricarboxylate transporter receptor subunit TctC
MARQGLPAFGKGAAQLAAALLLSISASGAHAAEDFYKGKQIRIIVSTDAVGTYNAYARLFAEHWPRYIPGNPTIIVQNMPGAAGIKAANYIYNAAPKDGTVIAATHADIPTGPLTNPKEAQYDPSKISWIGSATKELYVGYYWHAAAAKTLQDAYTKQPIMGGTSTGSFSIDAAVLANEFFGTKFKIITGYKGSGDTQLALEKGEVEGVMATTYNNVKARSDWTSGNKINIFVQYGLTRHPLFPDLPLYIDLAKNEADRQAIRFLVSRLDHGKLYFAPPDVPADRLEILRRSFDAVLKDEAFLKDVATAKLEIDGPMTGEELARTASEESATPPAVIQRIEAAITKFKASQ